jgi:cysteine desulfuration protein SufE
MNAPFLETKQQALVEKFEFIPDVQERLAAVVAHKPKLAPLPAEAKIDANLVRGCSSRVWLTGFVAENACHFQFESESPLVRGLVGLLCELYESAPPAEVVAFEPEIFDCLGISQNLSPTRLNGLASVRHAIKRIASASA